MGNKATFPRRFRKRVKRRVLILDECERAGKLRRGAFVGGFWVDQGHRAEAGRKGERRLRWRVSASEVAGRMETFGTASRTKDLRADGITERHKGRKEAMTLPRFLMKHLGSARKPREAENFPG